MKKSEGAVTVLPVASDNKGAGGLQKQNVASNPLKLEVIKGGTNWKGCSC